MSFSCDGAELGNPIDCSTDWYGVEISVKSTVINGVEGKVVASCVILLELEDGMLVNDVSVSSIDRAKGLQLLQ